MKPKLSLKPFPAWEWSELSTQEADLILHIFCPLCGETTQQVYIRDLGIYEEYLCQRCGMLHRVAVR